MNEYTKTTLIIARINKIKLNTRVTKSDNINNVLGRMQGNKQIVDLNLNKSSLKKRNFITSMPIMRRIIGKDTEAASSITSL